MSLCTRPKISLAFVAPSFVHELFWNSNLWPCEVALILQNKFLAIIGTCSTLMKVPLTMFSHISMVTSMLPFPMASSIELSPM
jgi:hypothetical protein